MPPNFFKEQRERLGLSQRAMAKRLDMSNQAVSQWEAAASYPTAPVTTLAKAYEVSWDRMAKEVMALRRYIEQRQGLAMAV